MDSTDIEVKFIFANYEKRTTLTTTRNALGRELKQMLVESWPEGPKFPVFDHPTPINVSIRPANAATSQSQLSGKSSLLPSFIAGIAPPSAAASRPAGGAQVSGTGTGTRLGNNSNADPNTNPNSNPNINPNINTNINPNIISNNQSGAAGDAGDSDTAAAASGAQMQHSNNSMGSNSNNNNSRPPRSNQSTSGNSCCTVQ